VLVNGGSHVKVTSFNDIPCELIALIDSDSYASFIFPSWFYKYFDRNAIVRPSTSSYIAINKLPLPVIGTISALIRFEALPQLNGQIDLEVLREDGFKENLVIGRNFMENHGITTVYTVAQLSRFQRVRN